jgi:hypothetical protein
MKFKIIIEFRQEYNMEYTHTIWFNDEIEEDEIQEEIGIRQEFDRNSTGIRQELDRNSTGTRQEFDRNSTSQVAKSKEDFNTICIQLDIYVFSQPY